MDHLWQIQHSYLIPLLPLVGAAIAGFFGARWLKGNSHWPIWIGVGCSAILSLWLLFGMIGLSAHADASAHGEAAQTLGYNKVLFNWISSGNFTAEAGFWFDPLTAVMLCVVTCIGLLITIFAAGYMKGEEGYF